MEVTASYEHAAYYGTKLFTSIKSLFVQALGVIKSYISGAHLEEWIVHWIGVPGVRGSNPDLREWNIVLIPSLIVIILDLVQCLAYHLVLE